MIPLVVLTLAILASVVMLVTHARASVVPLFRAAMLLLMLSGAIGAVLHYRANMEFKLEMDPSLGGGALFWSVIRAKAPPALAPGNMALLGLLGLACAYRLDRRAISRNSQPQ
jgi:disulfide bond formation protein DsbB